VTPPVAVVQTAATIRSAGGTEYRFVIRYTDASGVDVDSLSNGDVLVTGPGGFSSGVTLLDATPSNGGRTVDARYQLAARGGTWGAEDNGAYALTVRKQQVADLAGNVAPVTVAGTFAVSIAVVSRPRPARVFSVLPVTRTEDDEAPVWR